MLIIVLRVAAIFFIILYLASFFLVWLLSSWMLDKLFGKEPHA